MVLAKRTIGSKPPTSAWAVLWVGFTLSFASLPVQADRTDAPSIAHFRTGGSLAVKRAERQGSWTVLHLLEGGELAVPSQHLVRIEPWGKGGRAPRAEAPRAEPLPATRALTQQPRLAPTPDAVLRRSRVAADPIERYRDLVSEAAALNDLDPDLLIAMVKVESNFDPQAVSHRGAQGLLQLMPRTSRRLGVQDPFDPQQNLAAGARLMRQLLERFEGDLVLALAAYNAGEKAVKTHGGLPPFPETESYIDQVLTHFAAGL